MSETAMSWDDEPTRHTADAPGWFGKMPGLGDFASRRLPEAFVSRWDGLLQSGLLHAQRSGDGWLEAYLVAPIWRFWLARGTVDENAWGGLLMPSIDRVGRHYPLTLAQPLDSLACALAAVDWYRALDSAARQVLDLSFTVEDFEQVLQTITPPRVHGNAASELADRLSRPYAEAQAFSVWWCGDAADATNFLCVPALPTAQGLAAMWAPTS